MSCAKGSATIVINNGCLEGKICLPVLAQQIARLYGMVNGISAPNVITYHCPDMGKVVYEIHRDPDHWWKDAMSHSPLQHDFYGPAITLVDMTAR